MTGLILILIVIFCFQSRVQADEERKVVFDEIFWSGSFVSSADEFLKLKNISSENIDLSGWQITRYNSKDSKEELMVTIPSGTIPAGGYFLISNSSKDHKYTHGESILNTDPDLVDNTVDLDDNYFELKIYDGERNDGRKAVDIAGNRDKPFAGTGSNNSKSSMQRKYPIADGAISESWETTPLSATTVSPNLDAGSSERANPISSGKPDIISFEINPSVIYSDSLAHKITFRAEIIDPNESDQIKTVELDLASLGMENIEMKDNGLNGDALAGDGEYYYETEIGGISPGDKSVSINAIDTNNLVDTKIENIRVYELSDEVKINEVFPHPLNDSSSEFIELYNSGEKDINLLGWKIDDVKGGGSNPYQIINDLIIPSHGYLTLYKDETKIGLNDDGDIVNLIDPSGNTVDSIEYSKAKENQSYNKSKNPWVWSETVTPNVQNIIFTSSDSSNKIINDNSSTSNQPNIIEEKIISINDINSDKVSTQITIVGIVNSLPGNFSNQYFYIQDQNTGIQIYSYKKDFPTLTIGDKIKVTGDLTFTQSGYRIKISDKENIIVLSENNILENIDLLYLKSEDKNNGTLASFSGKITDKSGDYLTVSNGSEKISVYIIKLTEIDKKNYETGMDLFILGILVHYKDIWRLQPRNSDDIRIKTATPSQSEEKTVNRLIGIAHAEEPQIQGNSMVTVLGSSAKASEVNNETISKHDLLIKTVKIVIIISAILLILLIGDKYAK
jgi:hypothetical protein